MIEKIINSEFGAYTQKQNHGHVVNYRYMCIDAYEDVPKYEDWMKCPCCNLKPKVWRFNNGRQTACGCGNSKYDHFSVFAESITSVITRCKGITAEYNYDGLRLNWNEYCSTMINPCSHADLRFEEKW